MTDDGFHVDPEEIDAHAKQVEATYGELTTALEAAHQRMDEGGFGLIGTVLGLGLWCNNTMERATETLQAAADAGKRHVDTVHQWAQVKRVDEESVQNLLKKAEAHG
ncbi:hypothetical protein [Amycolatopsis anabasis]|uniref:hypothetical protein n=1 Tax=Amycolatopsis anabasis TaxID=1840409 RepID=UPI00131E958E|nr:hypothetical protein [Amycolatopsis anabasis]